jgi:hypothetical protein
MSEKDMKREAYNQFKLIHTRSERKFHQEVIFQEEYQPRSAVCNDKERNLIE